MTNSTIELHALLIWCIVYAITEVGHMTTSERVQGANDGKRPPPCVRVCSQTVLVPRRRRLPLTPAPEIATAIPTITLSDNPTSVTDND